jgi:hypothetical protein
VRLSVVLACSLACCFLRYCGGHGGQGWYCGAACFFAISLSPRSFELVCCRIAVCILAQFRYFVFSTSIMAMAREEVAAAAAAVHEAADIVCKWEGRDALLDETPSLFMAYVQDYREAVGGLVNDDHLKDGCFDGIKTVGEDLLADQSIRDALQRMVELSVITVDMFMYFSVDLFCNKFKKKEVGPCQLVQWLMSKFVMVCLYFALFSLQLPAILTICVCSVLYKGSS